jgi:hypothetical protein
MSVFNINNKNKHTEALAFLDESGAQPIQRYDTLKYRQFDKLTDKQLGFFLAPRRSRCIKRCQGLQRTH